MKIIPALLVLVAACTLPFSVSAQWQWVDKNGRKVFSDRPPPADVPEKNILKQPNSHLRVSDAPAAAGTPAAATAPSGTPPPSAGKPNGVDKELMERKKQLADAEAVKRKAEEERIAKQQAESCARARQAKVGLDAGARIARTNEKGEREFLDDAARADEARRVQAIIEADCK